MAKKWWGFVNIHTFHHLLPHGSHVLLLSSNFWCHPHILTEITLVSVRDGICVDPPLCRESSQGKYGSCAKRLGCEGENVGKIGDVGERITCAGGQCQVRQRTRHDTWMRKYFAAHQGLQSWAIRPSSHACSRDEKWSDCAVWCADTLRATVHAVWVGVLFTHRVGCLEVFLQATETGPNSENYCHESSDHEECLDFPLLVFQLVRSQFVDEDEAVGKSHRDSL